MAKEQHNYDDIIDLPHPTSKRHPRMAAIDRAAQFSPFAAMTGYEDAVRETARLTDSRIELDEYQKQTLDERIHIIQAQLVNEHPKVTLTYFVEDQNKSGGEYRVIAEYIKKIDIYKRQIILENGTEIPMNDILDISL